MVSHVQSVLMEEEESDTLTGLVDKKSPVKHSDTLESISSVDSDLSLSFDRRDSNVSRVETSSQAEDEGAHMADLSDSASDAGSNGGGKDSGCEVAAETQEPPYTPPSEELAERIVTQVEFYFSDVNITKDAFLLKHVKRNKEGYVSLKLISSFKRVKHLTKDWRVVAEALKRSHKLQINEAGTKLRRLDPLPQYDETTPSRTIVAVHMPIDKPSIDNVSHLFSGCGEIALIRVLRPGNPIPADVRTFINKNPTLGGLVCALVEFTESESARNALNLQNYDFPGFGPCLKVYELNNVPKEPRKKSYAGKKLPATRGHECEYSSSCCSGSEPEYDYRMHGDPRMRFRRGSSAHFPPRSPEVQTWLPRRMSACSHSGSDSGMSGIYYSPRRMSNSSRDSGSEMFLSRRMSNCSLSGSEYGGGLRRFSNCSQASDYSGPPRSRSNSTHMCQEHLTRTPVGPDGTRGFHNNGARQRRISDLALYSR